MNYTIKNSCIAIANIWLWCLLLSIPTQAQQNLTNKEVLEVTDAWEAYKKAVINNDTNTLMAMTFPVVYCSECYQNTEEERHYIDSLREAPNDDYSNIIEQLYRVNKTTFIHNDIPILFNNDPWLHYKFDVIQDKHNLMAIINDKNLRKQVQGLFGVLITVSEATEKEQGFQIILNFVNVKNKGYQMCGYSTIP